MEKSGIFTSKKVPKAILEIQPKDGKHFPKMIEILSKTHASDSFKFINPNPEIVYVMIHTAIPMPCCMQ